MYVHVYVFVCLSKGTVFMDMMASWQEVTTLTVSSYFLNCQHFTPELFVCTEGGTTKRKWQHGLELHSAPYMGSNCKTIVEQKTICMSTILNSSQLVMKSIKTHAVYYQLTEIKCFCSQNTSRFNFWGMNMWNEALLLQPSDEKEASGSFRKEI